MVRRTTTRTRTRRTPARTMEPAKAVRIAKASAAKAWEAGVDAATTMRRSAVGAFNSLVRKGAAIEAASRKAGLEQVKRARRAALASANAARNAALERAHSARTRTAEAMSQLEKVFEKRVSRTISKLGVPTTKDVRALSRQVAELQTSVERLRRSRARGA